MNYTYKIEPISTATEMTAYRISFFKDGYLDNRWTCSTEDEAAMFVQAVIRLQQNFGQSTS